MRRFIAMVLLFFVPLQASFAAAAAYCSLETSKVPAHFGHHEHADSLPKGDSDSSKKLDRECGICHLGCVQAQLSASQALPPIEAQQSFAATDDPEPDHLPEASERPPRHPLA